MHITQNSVVHAEYHLEAKTGNHKLQKETNEERGLGVLATSNAHSKAQCSKAAAKAKVSFRHDHNEWNFRRLTKKIFC